MPVSVSSRRKRQINRPPQKSKEALLSTGQNLRPASDKALDVKIKKPQREPEVAGKVRRVEDLVGIHTVRFYSGLIVSGRKPKSSKDSQSSHDA